MSLSLTARAKLHSLAALLTSRRMTLWGAGLLVLSWFVYIHTMLPAGLIDRVGRVKAPDYVQFYVSGSMMLDGRSEALYDPQAHLAEGRRRILPDLKLYAEHPNYGPQVALFFSPLARMPYEWSLGLFLVLTALCYAAAVRIIWKECPGLQDHGQLVAVLAAASPLFFSQLRYGQASAFALLMWAFALAALTRQRAFVAGLALGALIYKPPLAAVIGICVLATGQWRVAAGAVSMAAGQLALGWWAGGSAAMGSYFAQLWVLMLDPSLVQIYPSEVHSLRGFFQLVLPSPHAVTIGHLIGVLLIVAAAIRSWSSAMPVRLRVGVSIVLTVLASPHLLTYDLLLLTLPLLVIADWVVQHPHHRLRPGVSVLLALAYFAPFSSNLARLVPIQVSVIILAVLSYRLYVICAERQAWDRDPEPTS
jgi:alpha-1,2-mannosyltransferase